MRFEILREHQEIRRAGVREPVRIEIRGVIGRVGGIKLEQGLVGRIRRVHRHFRFDAAHRPHHHLVDANALEARRRVFDSAWITRSGPAESVIPPPVRHAGSELGLRMVGISPVDQIRGQLQAPQPRVGRETPGVADQVAENALRQGRGVPAHPDRHHPHVLAQQAQTEVLRLQGQPQREQPVAKIVAPVLGQHRINLPGERIVVVEAKTG